MDGELRTSRSFAGGGAHPTHRVQRRTSLGAGVTEAPPAGRTHVVRRAHQTEHHQRRRESGQMDMDGAQPRSYHVRRAFASPLQSPNASDSSVMRHLQPLFEAPARREGMEGRAEDVGGGGFGEPSPHRPHRPVLGHHRHHQHGSAPSGGRRKERPISRDREDGARAGMRSRGEPV
eukprot:RCo030556